MAGEQGLGRQQTEKALSGLRDLVLKGEIAAGERLSEVMLAGRLKVSRTPLRAALQKLELEGLVDLIPSGGYQVRRFSQDDVIDAIELRGVLEGTAARLAAERGVSPAKLKAIHEVVRKLDEAFEPAPPEMDFERYAALNGRFHAMLADLAGSDLLARELERARRLPFASPNAFVGAEGHARAFQQTLIVGQAQHKAVLSAIELREGSRAESIAREHARLARQNLDFVLQEQPELKNKVAALALMAG